MVDDADSEAIRNEVPVERLLTGTHRVLRFTVGRNHGKGWRIDKYLSALLPTISRTMILGWVERGSATVDGVAVHERVRLRPGQRVELYGPLPKRDLDAGYPAPLQILYRDEWLLAVNKPPGQLAHQAGKTMSGTMINQAQDWFEAEGGDPLQVRLVNRIDRDTSGILLLSFDAAVHAQVSTAFAERDLSKEYRAICHGIPVEAHGHWREPLGEGPPESIARVVRPDGQESHTEYEVVETAGQTPDAPTFSHLKISLHTGRQHQIRVHASHHGHPLVGDWVYGPACAELGGQALHSAVLEFQHPKLKRMLRIEAPLPARLADLWTHLKAGRRLTPVSLDAEQRSKLGLETPRPSLRRPSWLSDEEFARLREEAGE